MDGGSLKVTTKDSTYGTHSILPFRLVAFLMRCFDLLVNAGDVLSDLKVHGDPNAPSNEQSSLNIAITGVKIRA